MKMRKKLLSLMLALVMLLSLSITANAEGEQGMAGAIVIIHTNDIQGAIDGYAKVAAMKQVYEAQGAYVLLVDAGGYARGYVSTSQGEAAIELMNAAGYDVAAVGDDEFAYGYENLQTLAGKADFPLVTANVRHGGKQAFEAHRIFEAPGGTKIGIFGLTAPEVQVEEVDVLAEQALMDCARAQVEQLEKAGCDWIVCLSHLGMDEKSEGNRSIDLLEAVSGIDFLIDAHSCSTLEEIKAATGGSAVVGNTAITSSGAKFNNVGVLVIKDGEYVSMNLAGDTIIVSDEAVAAKVQEVKDAASAAMGYTDVSPDAWYADAVRFVTAEGLMNGSGGAFDPKGTLNRAMMVTVLWRLEGSPDLPNDYEVPSFDDVNPERGAWYYDAVRWATYEGITTGATATTFNPTGAITREQLATFLYRYAGSPAVEADLSGYTDAEAVSSYAEEAMVWANAQGLVTGTTATTLSPKDTANRATVATVLMRYVEK